MEDRGKTGKLTSRVRFNTLVRTKSFCINHQNRVCSPELTRWSKSSINESKSIVSCSSFRRNAGSTCILMDRIKPVDPRPHSDALNSSVRLVLEQVTMDLSASISSSSSTIVDKTPKVNPVPWVAVDTTPARVWSEIDPRLDIARPCFSRHACRSLKIIPPWATTTHFSVSTF